MDTECYDRIERGRRDAHGCSLSLEPVGISKFEDIVLHDDSQNFKK
jgi:hypothetical protein